MAEWIREKLPIREIDTGDRLRRVAGKAMDSKLRGLDILADPFHEAACFEIVSAFHYTVPPSNNICLKIVCIQIICMA